MCGLVAQFSVVTAFTGGGNVFYVGSGLASVETNPSRTIQAPSGAAQGNSPGEMQRQFP